MAISNAIAAQGPNVEGMMQWPFRAVGKAFEVIPRTLSENCGADTVKLLTKLRAKHSTPGNSTWGVDGIEGCLRDMTEIAIWEPFEVKVQTIKTSIEAACMLLRIDAIVSGMKKKEN